jgi:hypothetical protein
MLPAMNSIQQVLCHIYIKARRVLPTSLDSHATQKMMSLVVLHGKHF